MRLQIGDAAPNFELFDSTKTMVSLKDFEGQNILILFFPLAFTSVCTKELCDVRDQISVFNMFNTSVLGISVDSLYTLAEFKEQQQINFPLLSDFNKEISSMYGSLYDLFSYGMKGVSKRSAFIIDKGGIIRFCEILDKASDIPDFVKIKEVLEQLKTINV